jgi:general nucleoside transport system permease protein
MPLALFIGGLMGALFAGIAGALRAYTGAHEVITTIMLNFIAINITDYLADGPWKAEGIIARTPLIEPSAAIPVWGSLPAGFFIAAFMAFATWYLLFRTTLGYEIRTVGLNPNAAHYAGIKVARIIVLTMAISGLLAGMGGAIETLGIVGRYQPGFQYRAGLRRHHHRPAGPHQPARCHSRCLLVGAMQAGSSRMQFDAGVQSQIIDVIQALILFFVSADMIVRWIIRTRADDGGGVTISSGWGSS